MKQILIIAIALMASACSTPQPKGYELPPALSEVFRGGQLQPLQDTQGQGAVLGAPERINRVGMVCTQEPIYDLEGYYVRTDVRCF